MATFSNFSEHGRSSIRHQVLQFMHSYCLLLPSLVPFLLCTLPKGIGLSEGGVIKRRDDRKNASNKSDSNVNRTQDKLAGLEAIFMKVTTPTTEETALMSITLLKGRLDTLQSCYAMYNIYKTQCADDKADKIMKQNYMMEKNYISTSSL